MVWKSGNLGKCLKCRSTGSIPGMEIKDVYQRDSDIFIRFKGEPDLFFDK